MTPTRAMAWRVARATPLAPVPRNLKSSLIHRHLGDAPSGEQAIGEAPTMDDAAAIGGGRS